jgi:acylphosphatase
MKKAMRICIYGVVQNVFFRAFVKDNADKLKLKGYVRNKEDGSVECWLEGEDKNVLSMIEICKQGPKHSVIKRFDEIEEKHHGFKDFRIIHF